MDVDHEDPGEGVAGGGGPSDAVERLCLGRLRVDGDELGAHQAAGGHRLVAEQRSEAPLLDEWEELEDVVAPFFVELGDEVGGVVGLHPGDELGDLRVALDPRAASSCCSSASSSNTSASSSGSWWTAAMISSPWLRGAASTRSASSAGCSRASFGCGTRSWTVGMWPVNGSRLAQSRKLETPIRCASRAWEQPPQQAAQADVDPDDPPPALDPGDLDLVRAHEPGAVDVDQLPVEDVVLEQHLALAAAEGLQVEA